MKFIGQLLGGHLRRYPRMQLADLYKLLHQAALGPGHALGDASQAHARLRAELAALDSGPPDSGPPNSGPPDSGPPDSRPLARGSLGRAPEEPLVDRISPDGRLARVHLRPYLAGGHDYAALAEAFVRSAQACPPEAGKLARFCGCLGDLADAGGIPFTRAEVAAYFEPIAAQGYPAVRHSPLFREAYRPAYRVIAIELLPALQ